jgi:dihydrofolate reductase
MTKVYTGASMSLDGYISGPGESGFEHLFAWYNAGDIEVRTGHADLTFNLTETSAAHWREIQDMTGALVVGRKLFDFTEGWGGKHPMEKPVVVLSHSVPEGWQRAGEWFTFVDEGIEAAVAKAKELAAGRGVAVNGGTIASQCLSAGLVDEVWVDLVPVLLGGGTPFFEHLKTAPVSLEGPTLVAESKRVTHLRYRVRT